VILAAAGRPAGSAEVLLALGHGRDGGESAAPQRRLTRGCGLELFAFAVRVGLLLWWRSASAARFPPLPLGLPLDPEQVQKLAAMLLAAWGALMIQPEPGLLIPEFQARASSRISSASSPSSTPLDLVAEVAGQFQARPSLSRMAFSSASPRHCAGHRTLRRTGAGGQLEHVLLGFGVFRAGGDRDPERMSSSRDCRFAVTSGQAAA